MKSALKKIKTLKKEWFYGGIMLGIIVFAWYVSSFWYQLIMIQGESMSPTYHNNQITVISKHDITIHPGDVIVFRNDNLDIVLVKRVVALPQQTVEIKNGTLYVDNVVCESFMGQYISYAGKAEHKITLAEDEYFVLGDNYEYSKDSRYEEVGLVKKETIIGKLMR